MGTFSIDESMFPDHPEIAVVTASGEMDMTELQRVESVMNPLLENNSVAMVVFDVSELSYMNSRSVGLLMNYYGILKERNRQLILVGLQDGVKDTLSLVGVTQLVPIYDSLEDFAATVK